MVFSTDWFKQHQKGLLFLCNNPVLKYWFRWVLRIDLSPKIKIYRLEPNCFTWQTGNENEFTTDFRTHNKYAKRLYHAFKPFWYCLHFWDWLTFETPQLSFGFDTLTVYPDADPETNSCDGYAQYSKANQTWATCHDTAGTGINDILANATTPMIQSGSTTGRFNAIRRSFFFFYTAALTSNATISAAVLSIYGYDKYDPASWAPSFNIYDTTSTSTTGLASADYLTAGTTAYSTAITYANWSTTGYNDYTLNATGLAAISKTGLSRFCHRESTYDVANSAPTWSSNKSCYTAVYLADRTATTEDPKLVVTYTLASTFTPQVRIIN